MAKTAKKKAHPRQPATTRAASQAKAGGEVRELTDAELDKVAGGVGIVSRRGLDPGLDQIEVGVAVVKRVRR